MPSPRLFGLPLLLVASACTQVPLAAYQNRGGPESLLNASSEVVAVQLTGEDSINELTNWLENDQASRADLHCAAGDPLCSQAEETLKAYGLDYKTDGAAQSSVDLIYERIVARDCESRYIDNSVNPYNLPHPTSGCSIAANMIQMVGDKKQFVSPGLLDYHDGNKTLQTYNAYLAPELKETQKESTTLETVANQARR